MAPVNSPEYCCFYFFILFLPLGQEHFQESEVLQRQGSIFFKCYLIYRYTKGMTQGGCEMYAIF